MATLAKKMLQLNDAQVQKINAHRIDSMNQANTFSTQRKKGFRGVLRRVLAGSKANLRLVRLQKRKIA